MSSFFKNMDENVPKHEGETGESGQEENTEKPTFNFDKTTGMPNLDEIHGHLKLLISLKNLLSPNLTINFRQFL